MKNVLKIISLALLLLVSNSYAMGSFTGKIISPIPDNIKKIMIGHSWHEGCPVSLNELVYLQLPYWGFDDKPHMGEMIMHRVVAQDVVDIFEKLYAAHFPIEQMKLPERYSKKIYTSGFYCRNDEQQPGKYSPHAFGLAIDINILYNPSYIANDKVDPEAGRKYLDRSLNTKGMIKAGDIVTTTFYEHGWIWGAYFKDGADYQHFQKMMNAKYMVNSISHRDKNENPTLPSYFG